MQKTCNKQVHEEASEWVVEVRVGDMDAAAREQLDAWFRRSPEHIRAFLQLSCLWEELEDSNLDCDNNIDTLIARARAGTNVIALEGEGAASVPRGPDALHRRTVGAPGGGVLALSRFLSWRTGILAAVGLVCLGLGLFASDVYWNTDYATGTGEQRIVHLADGSTVELNSNSLIHVFLSKGERDVELVEGQALFRVAKDHTRPFVVRSAGTRVRAVGTQFDVYRKASGTQVTVVEGRVAVFMAGPQRARAQGQTPVSASEPMSSTEEKLPAQPTAAGFIAEAPVLLLSSGEQVIVTNQQVAKPRRADLRAATAWTERKLIFDVTPLAEVVQEFNRYNTRKLVVSDGTLADFHVTGVFSCADPNSLLQFLQAQRDVEVVEVGGEMRISKK